MSGAGVLADRKAQTASLNFRQFNLVYGFNGSGKSTLSRMFASLQLGKPVPKFPAGGSFEFELADGTTLRSPDQLGGLEKNVLVFNHDFIDDNLHWTEGSANPVFYIGRQQAELARELSETEAKLPLATQTATNATANLKAKTKAFGEYKTTRAKLIAGLLREPGRKYEAPQLVRDLGQLDLGPEASLDDDALNAAVQTCTLDQPMPPLASVALDAATVDAAIRQARGFASQTYGAVVMKDLQAHPEMLVWVKDGHDYHTSKGLSDCLLCGNPISAERRQLLEAALDDRLERFIRAVGEARQGTEALAAELGRLKAGLPAAESFASELRKHYAPLAATLQTELDRSATLLRSAAEALRRKESRPTQSLDGSVLPGEQQVATAIASLTTTLRDVNGVIGQHNEHVEGFAAHQAAARLSVRRHYVRQSKADLDRLSADEAKATDEKGRAEAALAALRERASQLRSAIQEHGPAADQMNKLIASYLGHGELTITAVKDGYEIHRRGRIVEGPPSEGEKTAIAICYFLSMLEAEGRTVKRQVVVVDDPISSLDTKALNFACALLLSRLKEAEQLFVLTHNQHCMNEFKKAWKNKARNDDPEEVTARLYFIDVAMDAKTGNRTSTLVEMSKFLREYDHEYHYLADHVFKFESSKEYGYAYMMPNVLRRLLDIFLAFRCPGSNSMLQKLEVLAKDFEVNIDQLRALERLAQVESHSDSLDDLIGFSSMTLEETKASASALIAMMEAVDPDHLRRLRGICGAA